MREDMEYLRIKKMCSRFLDEIPLQYIMDHIEKLGGKVTLSPETQHCAACQGYLADAKNSTGDLTPCPGVEP